MEIGISGPEDILWMQRKAGCANGGAESMQSLSCIKKRTSNLTIWRSKSGAPPGTRTLGPLIKRNQRATIVNFQNYADSLFLSLYRKFAFCICCILCTCHSLLHPLSSRSGVQKVCKNVQSQNQPLKTGIGFLYKAGKTAGFEPKTVATILPV